MQDWAGFLNPRAWVYLSLCRPFTSNIAYGIIGGIAAYVICKFFTYQLFAFQANWPGEHTSPATLLWIWRWRHSTVKCMFQPRKTGVRKHTAMLAKLRVVRTLASRPAWRCRPLQVWACTSAQVAPSPCSCHAPAGTAALVSHTGSAAACRTVTGSARHSHANWLSCRTHGSAQSLVWRWHCGTSDVPPEAWRCIAMAA